MVIYRLEEIEVADLRIAIFRVNSVNDFVVFKTCKRIIMVAVSMVLRQNIQGLFMPVMLDKPLLIVRLFAFLTHALPTYSW